jgi:uncharacterized protein (TIGR02246 family)
VEQWELVARERIRDLVAHYNLAGDRGWIDDMLDLFAPDATMCISGVEHNGRDAIRSVFTTAKGPRPELIRHHVSTLKIDVADPDHASARSYFQVLTVRGLDHWGRYTDRFVRKDDDWRFSHRSVRVDGATPGGWAAMRTSSDIASAEQPGRHDVP